VFQIGHSLREARTRRGLTPADVHKAIRIRERYLTALEEERWDMLPGEAYTKGFLRTYAEYLGLNSQLYVDEFNTRIARRDEEPFVPYPAVAERSLRRGILVALGSILVVGGAVAGLAAWQLGGSSTPPRSAPQAGGAAAPPTTRALHPKRSKPKTTTASTAPTFTSISASRGRCWLLVRDGGPNGTVVFEGVLEQGQAKRFRVSSRLWVRMGNPGALDITLAGKHVGGLPATPSNVMLTRSGASSA
jgi:Helix-turn-helix domain/RodZ C-terminal domain